MLPPFEVGEVLEKHCLILFAAEVLTGILVELADKLGAELRHFFHGLVAGECPVFVAIDAVIFVL